MAKPNYNFDSTSSGSVKSMSFYRMSDAPPNWAQNDPEQPDYIANKDFAELSVIVDGEEFIQAESGVVEPVEFRSGENVELVPSVELHEGRNGSKVKNVVTINAVVPEIPKQNTVAVNGQIIYNNINFEGDDDIKLSTIPGKEAVTIKVTSTEKDTVRPIMVEGQVVLDDNVSSGGLNLKGGKNVNLTVENNSVIISASDTGSNPGDEGVYNYVEGDGIDIVEDSTQGSKIVSLEKDFITSEYVKSISTTKLIQEQGITLVLNGGNANG